MTQPSLQFGRDALDVGAPAQRRSATSRRAAEHLTASGVQGRRMAALLAAYAAVGTPGLAMFEVHQRSGVRESSICSLRDAAVEKGWLLPLAETRVSPETKREQALHRITTIGLRELAEWKARQSCA